MQTYRIVGVLLLLSQSALMAEGKAENAGDQPKALSGISIVGNNETPKSLYIVPWKSSEVGMQNDLKSSLLNEGMVPVDKEVFKRELEFYEISNTN